MHVYHTESQVVELSYLHVLKTAWVILVHKGWQTPIQQG